MCVICYIWFCYEVGEYHNRESDAMAEEWHGMGDGDGGGGGDNGRTDGHKERRRGKHSKTEHEHNNTNNMFVRASVRRRRRVVGNGELLWGGKHDRSADGPR